MTTDVSEATVVTLYLLSASNLKLRPDPDPQLKPGARIVSHAFSMGDWQADKVDTFTDTAGQPAHTVSVEGRREDSAIDATYRARSPRGAPTCDAARAPARAPGVGPPGDLRRRRSCWSSCSGARARRGSRMPILAFVPLSSSTRACSTRAIARRARRRSTSAASPGSTTAGKGPASAASASAIPTHLYAEDLDLFGAGGLFELLATTRTRGGEDVLAAWLLRAGRPPTIARATGGRRRARAAARPARGPRGARAGRRGARCAPHDLLAWAAAPPQLHGGGRASCCRSSPPSRRR